MRVASATSHLADPSGFSAEMSSLWLFGVVLPGLGLALGLAFP